MKTGVATNKRSDWVADLMTFAIATVVLVAPAFLEPGDRLLGLHTRLLLPPCLFHLVTGAPCPLCGMTTSFSLMLHGRLVRSFLAHPAGPFVYVSILTVTVLGVLSHFGLIQKRRVISIPSWCWPLGLALLWVLRLGAWLAVR